MTDLIEPFLSIVAGFSAVVLIVCLFSWGVQNVIDWMDTDD